MSRLKDDGLLVIHISNRHLELQSVVSALARDAGVAIKTRTQTTKSTSLGDPGPRQWQFLRASRKPLQFNEEFGWKQPAGNDVSVWTDDYSNILGAIWRKYSN